MHFLISVEPLVCHPIEFGLVLLRGLWQSYQKCTDTANILPEDFVPIFLLEESENQGTLGILNHRYQMRDLM